MYKQDRQYCEWIARQETTNIHMTGFAQVIQQVDEIWEEYSREMMRELEEREQRLRINKTAKSQEINEQEGQHVNSATGCSHDDTDDHARQEKEKEAQEKREETRRLIERIVQDAATTARKKTGNSEV